MITDNSTFLIQKLLIIMSWLKKGNLVLVGQDYIKVIASQDAKRAIEELSRIKRLARRRGIKNGETEWLPLMLLGKYKLGPSAVQDLSKAHNVQKSR